MTVDQYLTLLSFAVWPITALIAGVAFVHGVRLAIDAVSDLHSAHTQNRRLERGQDLSNTFHMLRESIPQMVDHCASIIGIHLTNLADDRAASRTAELGLLALIQSRGGLPVPAPNGDPAVRQLVREVREMYDELEHPTPKPAKGAWVGPDPDADPDSEEAMLQELFGVGTGYGPGTTDDIDPEAEPIELPEDM